MITLIIDKTNEGIILMGMLGKKANENQFFNMGKFIKSSVEHFSGKGGGGFDYGQGFIKDKSLDVDTIKDYIRKKLLEF